MPGYTPNTWNVGDKITKPKLDRLEQAVADADVTNPASPAAAAAAATYPALRSTPPDPAVVVAYIDTSTVPPVLKGWDGSSWVAIGNAAVDGALLTESGDYLTLETGDILLAA